jgi:hypothetical protein
MTNSILRKLMAFVVLPPVWAFIQGCGSEEIKLQDVPRAQSPPTTPPEQQPPNLRPTKGSSAGMNYDPSGVHGPPPSSGGGNTPPPSAVYGGK